MQTLTSTTVRLGARSCARYPRRTLSTLTKSPWIYIHPPSSPSSSQKYTFTLTPTTSPETQPLALGTSTSPDPTSTPDDFEPNPAFLRLVQRVLAQYAVQDAGIQAQAAAFASQAGAALGGGGGVTKRRGARGLGGGAGPTSYQSGAGSGGHAGWLHVSDARNPPDWGRIAWPEDIFGSVQVDAAGGFIGAGGSYQESGTYRLVTRDGVLGLSEFLLGKVRQEIGRRGG